jgi:hypothetical protein
MYLKIGALFLFALLAAGCAASTTPAAPLTPTLAPAALSEQDAIALANQFYDLFITRQDFAGASGLFDDQMKAALPENKLQEARDSLPQRLGTFQSRSDARLTERIDQYQRVIIPMQYEKMAIHLLIVIDMTTGKISGLFFQPDQSAPAQQYETPAYVDAARFEEKDVNFGAAPWQLPGILSLPQGDGPFPAVVLVHGSGPNDRDETIGPHKPFKDLAQGLASQGIAVLRYDKRTKAYPQEMAQVQNLTVKEEAVDDAAAAVDFLRGQPQIDPQQVFVLGHSLGGYLAPRIARANTNIAGMILLAGATRPLEDMMLEQTRYILGSDGSLSAQDQAQIDQLQQQVDAVKALTPASAAVLGAPASYWLDLSDYRPAEEARGLTLPLLLLQGERDYQVTLQDFQNWQDELAGQTDVTFKSYPALNHLFMSGSGPSTPDEYQTPGNVAPETVQDIAQWIQQQK